jgi:hypothetical protein
LLVDLNRLFLGLPNCLFYRDRRVDWPVLELDPELVPYPSEPVFTEMLHRLDVILIDGFIRHPPPPKKETLKGMKLVKVRKESKYII